MEIFDMLLAGSSRFRELKLQKEEYVCLKALILLNSSMCECVYVCWGFVPARRGQWLIGLGADSGQFWAMSIKHAHYNIRPHPPDQRAQVYFQIFLLFKQNIFTGHAAAAVRAVS